MEQEKRQKEITRHGLIRVGLWLGGGWLLLVLCAWGILPDREVPGILWVGLGLLTAELAILWGKTWWESRRRGQAIPAGAPWWQAEKEELAAAGATFPIKVLVPGRVFRSDSDATHSPMFHQMEGLVVDKGITLCDLQGMLDKFVQALFGAEVKTRLRPSYFPFTEPSVEVDVSCFECGGKGCPLCKHTGWIEVLGAGVVHHSVLENCGIDPNVYSGFAFGIGIERIAMLKYGINNIGLMFENDLRFLKQFED